MAGAVSEDEEFEFMMAMEAEQAPAPEVEAPAQEDTPDFHLLKESVKTVGRGVAETVDFFTGLVSKSVIPDMTPAQRAAMTPIDWANLPQQPAVPTIKASPLGRALEREGGPQSRGIEALLKGLEFAGSAAVPLPGGALKNVLKEAGIFGAGGAVGDYVSDGSDVGALAGGLLTATRGIFVPQGLMKSYNAAKRAYSEAARIEEAENIVRQYAQDPSTAMAAVEKALKEGQRGTLAQLSKDKGLLALENRLAKGSDFNLELKQLNSEVSGGAIADVMSLVSPNANTTLPQTAAKTRVEGGLTQAKALAEKQVAKTAEAGQSKIDDIQRQAGVNVRLQEKGLSQTVAGMKQKAAQTLDDFNMKAMNEASAPGAKVTTTGPGGFTELKEGYRKGYQDAWGLVKEVPAQLGASVKKSIAQSKKLMTTKEGESLDIIVRELDDVMANPTAAKLQAFDNMVRKKAANAASGEVDHQLYEALQGVRETLKNSLPADARQALEAVNAQYPKYLATRSAGGSAEALKRGNKFTEEELLRGASKVGEETRRVEGVAPMQNVALPGVGRTAAEEAAIKATQQEGAAASKQVLSEADQLAKAASAETKAQAKALRQVESNRVNTIKTSPIAQYGQYEDPIKAIDSVFASKRPAESMRQLVKSIKTPAEREGLRKGVLDSLIKRVSKRGDLKVDAVDKFHDVAKSMDEVFTPAEMDDIRTALNEAEKIFSGKGIKMADIPEAGKGIGFYIVTMAGLNLGAKFGPNPLMGATVGKSFMQRFATKEPHAKTLKKLEDIMLNPQNYIDELKALEANPESQKAAARLLDKALGPVVQSQNLNEE